LKKGMMIRLYKKAAAPSALILDHKKWTFKISNKNKRLESKRRRFLILLMGMQVTLKASAW
jgi:hypothetical protein